MALFASVVLLNDSWAEALTLPAPRVAFALLFLADLAQAHPVIDHAVLVVLVTYAAYGLNTWHWLIAPLMVWLCYPRLTAPRKMPNPYTALAPCRTPCLLWAILAEQLASRSAAGLANRVDRRSPISAHRL